MARTRKQDNIALPPNLYPAGSGYYAYQNPLTGKRHSMGKDRQIAILAAHKLNDQLLPLAATAPPKPRHTFGDFLAHWETHTFPVLDIADATRIDYRQKLPHIRVALGNLETSHIRVVDIAQFLDRFPPKQSNNYRAFLSVLFKQAASRGLCASNPVAVTLKRTVKKQRQRLTIEAFRAIHAYAQPWFQNVLDLALLTLQRRGDLVSLKWEQVHDGCLWLQQHKVQKHGAGNLKIRITSEIAVVLERCRDNIPSHYILHRQPDKSRTAHGRIDATAILPGLVSKEWAKARKASGYYPAEADTASLPSFHEIRSLGAALYEKSGVPTQKVQALLGHTSAKMTDHYLQGHGVRWVQVEI